MLPIGQEKEEPRGFGCETTCYAIAMRLFANFLSGRAIFLLFYWHFQHVILRPLSDDGDDYMERASVTLLAQDLTI